MGGLIGEVGNGRREGKEKKRRGGAAAPREGWRLQPLGVKRFFRFFLMFRVWGVYLFLVPINCGRYLSIYRGFSEAKFKIIPQLAHFFNLILDF